MPSGLTGKQDTAATRSIPVQALPVPHSPGEDPSQGGRCIADTGEHPILPLDVPLRSCREAVARGLGHRAAGGREASVEAALSATVLANTICSPVGTAKAKDSSPMEHQGGQEAMVL